MLEPEPFEESDLQLIGWQWAGDAMLICMADPSAWTAWLDHVKHSIKG